MFRLTTSHKICPPCSGSAGSRSYFRRIHGSNLANRIPVAERIPSSFMAKEGL